jgi:tRNA threonylcarbamoyl adenosine modification protein YeaZ
VTTACLSRGDEVLAESATRGRSTGAQRVLADLETIVVGTGPGTFTGLRIGLATARSLGFALSVPVRGVGTLDALLQGDGVDVACVDARRGEVFAAGTGVPLGAYAPEALTALAPQGARIAGDGAVRYRDGLAGLDVPTDTSTLHVPWARHHARLLPSAGEPEPLYVRSPDADRVLAGRVAP